MKFDIVFIADGTAVAEAKNLSFIALITLIVAFPRKKYEKITFTIQTSDDEIQS